MTSGEPEAPRNAVRASKVRMGMRKLQQPKYFLSYAEETFKIPIAQAWRRVEDTFRPISQTMQDMYPKMVKLQKDLKANPIGPELLRYLQYPDGKDASTFAMKHNWGSKERAMANDTRELLRQSFGEGWQTFLTEYIPDAMGTKGVKEVSADMKPWLEHDFVPQLDDPYYLINSAIHTRARMHITPAISEMLDMVKQLRQRPELSEQQVGQLAQEVGTYIARKTYALMPDEAIATETLTQLNQALKLDLRGSVPSQLASHMLMLIRTSTMGGRLGVALRNSTQIFTTLYMYVPVQHFARGVERTFTKEGQALAKKLGLLEGEAAPQEEHLPRTSAPWLQWLHGKSMIPFKGAEYFTRSISANVGAVAIEVEMPKFLRGEISGPEFLRNTGVVYLEKPFQAEVLKHVEQAMHAPDAKTFTEAFTKAKEAYAFNLMEDTNWINRSANSPSIFAGKTGRVLGQFGTWPLAFIDFARRGVTTGDVRANMAFVGRWLLINAALYKVTKDVLGIDARPWLFEQQAMYSGGPMTSILADAVYAMRGGYRGEIGLANLKQDASVFIPLGGLMRDVKRTIEAPPEERLKRIAGFRPTEE